MSNNLRENWIHEATGVATVVDMLEVAGHFDGLDERSKARLMRVLSAYRTAEKEYFDPIIDAEKASA